jgi:Gluconate 2-dehydrogenase subunit 3
MTRREWLLDLGAGVVLAGITASGLEGAELPPGLYEPSRDHLTHALAGARLDAGSETEFIQVWVGPAFFDRAEYIAIFELIALLLGEPRDAPVVKEIAQWVDLTVAESAAVRTAALALTPAHRTLANHFYGAEAARRLEEFDPQAICREGLAWLNRERSFLERSTAEHLQMLRSIADDRPEPRTQNAGTRFFTYLKTRVAEGFYTSRAGLEELGRGQYSFHASPPGCQR